MNISARGAALPSPAGKGDRLRWMRRIIKQQYKSKRIKTMGYKYNKNLTMNARILRKNMTREEKHLWYDFLKRLPLTVNRQKNIGNFIVDFYIAEKRIVIELDGSQHGEEENAAADKKRDAELYKLGINVFRYSNTDINKRFNSVCEDILRKLEIAPTELK